MSHNHQPNEDELRCAVYARYSSDLQRKASLEDQKRNCRQYADDNVWAVLEDYVRGDEAKSGKSLVGRDALNSLIEEVQVKPRPFDVLLIDHTSRLGRNLGDVLNTVETFAHYGVKIIFVTQKLSSADPNFRVLLTIHGLVDEQQSEALRHNVHRGQKGRVIDGYSSGSRTFGYRSEAVPDPTAGDSHGRAAILGYKLEIVESQAATILRICEMFAGGLSVYEICSILSKEKVPAARKPRIGPSETAWNSNLIKRILQNPKYIGIVIWNKTHQKLNRKTQKIETFKKHKDEWVYTQVPELRIIPQELWGRVQDRLLVVNEKFKAHRLGGVNRAKRKDYLFSGLMKCGICGESINISGCGGGGVPAYECVSARNKRGCTNKLRIRHDRLSAQLIKAFAEQLLAPDVMAELVESVSKELELHYKGDAHNPGGPYEQLKAQQAEQKARVERMLDFIEAPKSAHSVALRARLAQAEVDLAETEKNLLSVSGPKGAAIPIQDIKALVRANVDDLLAVLKQDASKARQVLQRHIQSLILYPVETDAGWAYEVLGDIALFVSPSDPKKRVLLDRSSTPTIQQYTDTAFRFAGLLIDPLLEGDLEEPVVHVRGLFSLLSIILNKQPDLAGLLLTARDWGSHLDRISADQSAEQQGIYTPKYFGWLMHAYKQEFTKSLGMKTKYSHPRTFSFTAPQQKQPAMGLALDLPAICGDTDAIGCSDLSRPS